MSLDSVITMIKQMSLEDIDARLERLEQEAFGLRALRKAVQMLAEKQEDLVMSSRSAISNDLVGNSQEAALAASTLRRRKCYAIRAGKLLAYLKRTDAASMAAAADVIGSNELSVNKLLRDSQYKLIFEKVNEVVYLTDYGKKCERLIDE